MEDTKRRNSVDNHCEIQIKELVGPRARDEFLAAGPLSLCNVIRALADSAPTASLLQRLKQVEVSRSYPLPERFIPASLHPCADLLLVLGIRKDNEIQVHLTQLS